MMRIFTAIFPFLCVASLRAQPVPIPDGSFDNRTLNQGQWSNNISPWLETGGPGNGSGFVENIGGFSADGLNHLGMELNHDSWQDLAETYQANTRYTLTVAVGHRPGRGNANNQSQFHLADSTGTIHASGAQNSSTIPVGTFLDAAPLVFETPSSPSAIGRPIRILLRARGGDRSHFDNIRLTAETLVPPGGAVLVNPAATGITSTTANLGIVIADPGISDPAITFYWGTTDGGINPGDWEFSQSLPGSHTGSASLAITGLAPGGTYRFAARAQNAAGSSWLTPSATFETLPAPPGVATLEAENITAFSATLRAEVTDTGGSPPTVTLHYGPSDGGTNPDAWAGALDAGSGQGILTAALTTLDPASTWFFRASASNDGGTVWAADSRSFTTLAVFPPAVDAQSPTGITGASATLRGVVTDTGNAAPVVTLFLGTSDGGTDPSQWQTSFDGGVQSGAFGTFAASLDPETTYLYRVRASNSAGTAWSPTAVSFTTTAQVASSVVINEFHYKPADESTLGEFIELHNPGDQPADISNWRLTNAISYTFPTGTVIPPGGYLVIAQDPAVILAQYGVSALGPYSGALSSKGERINLRDAADQLIDRVEYGAGFPWPAAPDGGGPSVERIHPSLDGNLAGSWRASGTLPEGDPPAPIIPLQQSGWRIFRGTTEASTPIQAWRDTNFDDAAWETGRAPIGYGVAGLNTTISGMRFNFSTVYLRNEFTVPTGAVPNTLNVRLYLDDGCVIWINGTEVHRHLAPAGDLAHNALATTFVSAPQWYEFEIGNADEILFGGTNTIAVHLLNSALTSSDLAFDIELTDAATANPGKPTPGARNSVFTAPGLVPPHIDAVAHSPRAPQAGEPVTITARITDPDGVASATLTYQPVDPGAYIRLGDAAYETNWTPLPMTTDGTGTWSATLPASLQQNRRLIRYRIQFEDTLGNSQTVPYADDESPNFAWFVSDGIPAWQGAFRPGQTPLQSFTSETLTSIPVYTLIAADSDVINSQYNSSSNKVRMTGTFVHDGVVHDHIEFRNRGEGSIYQAGKNKWRFYFNRGSRFQAADADGHPYQESWKQFSGNPGSAAWAPLNRGAAGLDEMVPFRAYQLAGVPSPHTHHYHFRVIRGTGESPAPGTSLPNSIGTADGQYLGDFWGLYLAIEPIRGNFLSERNLPNGNIYKIEGNNGDKKEQAPGQPTDSADWIAFRNAHVNADPSEAWWRANLDLDAYFSFHAINRLVGNVDLRAGANHFFYHRSSDGRWVPIPWDLDMMFIAKHHWGSPFGNSVPDVIHAHKAILQHPQIALEYRNRAREILDLLASDATPDGGQIGQLIAEIGGRVHTPGATDSLAWADAHMWNLHPRTNGTDGNASGQGNHRGNFFRSPFNDSRNGGNWTRWLRNPSFTGTATPDDTFTYFLNYATDTWPGGNWIQNNGDQRGYGYQFVLAESRDPAIPAKPALAYSGAPGFPANQLAVTASAFSDPQGTHTFAARQWRLSEVGAPGLYEIDALWTATTTNTSESSLNLPSAGILPGRTYRARVRQQDDTGRWSHWSDPVEITATPGTDALVHYWNFNSSQEWLVASQTPGGAGLSVTGTHESGAGQDFAAANARFGDPAAAHLRVNNPLTPGTRIDLAIPTTGFSDVLVKYETRRSGQGAGTQHVAYTTDGLAFTDFTTLDVSESPAIAELDFRATPAAADNPHFAIRITFSQGGGGIAGNNRFDNLTVEGIPLVPSPHFIPATHALWNFPENWRHLTIPDAPEAVAVLGPPATGDRNVTLTNPATIGHLTLETADTTFRNRLNGGHTLTFDHNGTPATLTASGSGDGFTELEITGGVDLASDLILDVPHTGGHPEHGALRLRQPWTGPGGLAKHGPGMASLTGGDKSFTGPVTIHQGVLRFTASSAPAAASGVAVLSGGQLRLSSTGTPEEPAAHTFGGGPIQLAGTGRSGVPAGENLGVLGALRYEPYTSADHHALLPNPLHLNANATIHVAGGTNSLALAAPVTGPHTLAKSGGGTLLLLAHSPDAPPAIDIQNGTLDLRAHHPAAIHIGEPAVLAGTGTTATLTGPGTVAPGPPSLTASQSSAARIAAVLTTPGSAGNGVLALTHTSNPLPAAPHAIDLFLNPATPPVPGDRFHGGIIVPEGYDLIGALATTTLNLFIADPTGDTIHLGQTYRPAMADDLLTPAIRGNTLEVLKSGPPTTYQQWRNLHFPNPADHHDDSISGPAAKDATGIANLLRYAFNLHPADSADPHLPRLDPTTHTYRFNHDPTKTDLAWIVRSSPDLLGWPAILFDSRHNTPPPTDPDGLLPISYPPNLPRLFIRLELLLID